MTHAITTIVGNLTADPELRFTTKGVPVASFTIAATPRRFDKASNQWVDGETVFMRCSLWRDAAENAANTLVRGTRVIATGKLSQRTFTTKEGQQRTVIEMDVEEIGPSIRYATATISKVHRTTTHTNGSPVPHQGTPPQPQPHPVGSGPSQQPADPWATTRPVPPPTQDQEPPF